MLLFLRIQSRLSNSQSRTNSEFENRMKSLNSKTANHLLYLMQLISSRYPERDFGWNQLLDCSMSLSPLYPTLTSDLHVSNVRDLPSKFPLTSAKSGIDHNLSGTNIFTLTRYQCYSPCL